MQGNLDQPPLIITKSRRKIIGMLLLSVAITATGVWMWLDPRRHLSWVEGAGFLMFSLGCPLFGWQLFRPERLVICPIGLTWFGPWKAWSYRWDQLSEFSTYTVSPASGAKLIGFSLTGDGPRSVLAKLNTSITGMSGALPGLWEIPPEEVATLLNQARARWANPAAGETD
jgi:hypothetical protein